MANEAGNNIKTLYRILNDRGGAGVPSPRESKATGVPEPAAPEKNLLLCCIIARQRDPDPRGGDQIQVGDNVIVVTLEHGLHDLRDIVEN